MILKTLKELYVEARVSAKDNAQLSNRIMKPDALKLIQQFKLKINDKGIPVTDYPKELGRGAMGVAFDLGNETVLKVTGDRSEARAAKHLEGKNFKNVYKVLAVYELVASDPYKAPEQMKKGYIIHQEKLDPLPFDKYQGEYWGKSGHINIMIPEFIYELKLGKNIEQVEKLIRHDASSYNINEHQIKQVIKLADDMYNGLKELKSVGVEFIDYHLGNVMYRTSDQAYVLIDIGVSRSPGANIDPI